MDWERTPLLPSPHPSLFPATKFVVYTLADVYTGQRFVHGANIFLYFMLFTGKVHVSLQHYTVKNHHVTDNQGGP